MSETRRERTGRALAWISSRLRELEVPFQVAGGLAAIAHGATRELNDIDLYVPGGVLEGLARELEGHVSHGPFRHRGPRWDCYFMELHYEGQEIELAEGPRTRYRRGEGAPWHDAEVDFEAGVMRETFGVEIPVMPLEELIRYKSRLMRDVDRRDLEELEG